MKNKLHHFPLFIFCLCTVALFQSSFLYGQKETNKWYFGSGAGLDFNAGPTAINGQLNTVEGCSSISDPVTGNLLFYTDGITVWDATNTVMMNGTGLMGHFSSTQSALIVPMPGSTTKYYLFTTDAFENNGSSGYRYSIIDMAMNGGLGAVTSSKNVTLLAPSGEQSCAVKHSNCRDIWVMTHGYNNNGYYAFLVTANGINAPVISNSGANVSGVSVGQMKFSADGAKVAFSDWGSGTTQVSDFDNNTGVVSNSFTVYTGGSNNTYGLSFSPDGSRLYVSGGTYCTSVFQYNMLAGTNNAVASSQTFIGNTISYPQFQNATNGKLYISQQNNNYLAVINDPNSLGLSCGYVSNGQTLGSNVASIGLPNFAESNFYTYGPCVLTAIANSVNASCNGGNDGSASVTVSGGMPPYTYLWNPGGFTTSTVTGLSAGSYTVTVTDNLGSQFTDTVTVSEPPVLSVTTSPDITICSGESTILKATADGGTPAYTYLWDSTYTGQSYSVNPVVTTTYTVVAKDINNCTSGEATVTVKVNAAPVVVAGEDLEVCYGESVQLKAEGGINYSWFPVNGLSNSTIANPLASPLGTTTYTVSISDSVCSGTDDITVIVAPLPLVNTDPDSLVISIGLSVKLNIETDGSSFNWTPLTGLDCNDCPRPKASPDATTTYTVTVTNERGCTSSDSVVVVVDCEVYIPNAFSPDGDGINEYFLAYSNCITELTFRIYDRWGEIIFESTNLETGWDGTYRGNLSKSDVYVYQLTGKLATGKYLNKVGDVFLMR